MGMRFKVDENLPHEVAALLRQVGHDAVTILDQGMQGADDGVVIRICRKERRVLVTLDTDFANIQDYPPSQNAGILLFRLGLTSKRHVLTVLRRLLPLLRDEDVARHLWVIDEHSVRIHE